MKAWAANTLWLASCGPEARRFQRAAANVEETQSALLAQYLRANRETEYGCRFKFGSISSPSHYQERVPLTTYDDYTDYIARLSEGDSRLLTAEPVRIFELSSGSTAASKLIPYTDRLKSEFQRGLAPWIFDLYTHLPDLRRGPAYWSITPLTDGERFTSAGIPIGFESESAYLGRLGKWLLNSALGVPNAVKLIPDINGFRYATLLCLLRQPDLRLISVWNPTFLTLLLAPLSQWWNSLLNDIEHGTLTLPESATSAGLRFAPKPRLARALGALDPTSYDSLWPCLRLISCWMDGASGPYARQIETRFPGVRLQGKGLLATEAFVSFPLIGVEGAVLALNSHFFEFCPTAGGAPRLAHQLKKGQTCSVVVTTGGGFYRYQLHDIVEVVGHWRKSPCLRFVGKADHISDWFGEKLEERFVSHALAKVFTNHNISPAFAMLAPEHNRDFHYVLFLECTGTDDALAIDLDNALCENFHYAYCRKLGQLAALQVLPVMNGAETYLRACYARRQKMGNIKSSMLQKKTGWREWFEASEASSHEGHARCQFPP